MPATPLPTNPAGDDRNLVAVDPTPTLSFGDRLQLFWEKNSKAVLALCVMVILAVLAKGLWEYFAREKQVEIGREYAAATSPELLKAFAAKHPDHELGGIAQLRMADEAYAAGKFAEAVTGYDQALGVLKTGPLAARVQLGRAVAKIQAGDAADGSRELKQLADDANQLRAIRTEAGYHLASLAADARDSAQVQALSDQLMQIDPSSLWTQRALSLRANLPVTAAPASTGTPAVAAPATKQDGATPSVQLKMPGK